MPLVRIDLLEGKTLEYRTQVGEIVYQALLGVLGVPNRDRFQVITEHPKAGLQFDRDYLGVHRSDDCIFLQITLNSGRTVELKQRFYQAVADGLHERLKLRRRMSSSVWWKCRRKTGRSVMAKPSTYLPRAEFPALRFPP